MRARESIAAGTRARATIAAGTRARATIAAAAVTVIVVTSSACSAGAAASKPPATTPAEAAAAKPTTPCVADGLGPLDRKKSYARCDGIEKECLAKCEADDAEACFGLGRVIEMKADETGDAEGAVLADSLYRKACTLGAPNACTNHAAHLWAFGERGADLTCAQRLFEQTCEHDDPFGCGMAGRLLIDHADSPDDEDITRARALLERSCAQLGHFPCRILALNLERGLLGPVPDGRIQALLQQACEAGDEPACGEHATVEETFGP